MILYILYSEKSCLYYVGITHNLKKRLHQHNFSTGACPDNIGNSFTSKHRPWILKAAFHCKNESVAAWCEHYIKQQKSAKFIEKYILDEKSDHPILKNLMKMK